jgi:hypothetical protein
VGNSLTAGKSSPGLLDLACLFFADRFVVVGCAGQSAGKRIEHDLQQSDHGGDLAGSHAVDQFVRVSAVVGRTIAHDGEFSEIGLANASSIQPRICRVGLAHRIRNASRRGLPNLFELGMRFLYYLGDRARSFVTSVDIGKISAIATKIKTPLALSGLVFVVLYLLYRQVLSLDVFSNIGANSTFLLLQNVLGKLFLLALLALVLGVGSYLTSAILTHKVQRKSSNVELLDASLMDDDAGYEQVVEAGVKKIRRKTKT